MGQKLQLGCGLDPKDGFVNHDIRKHHDYIDVAHDLRKFPWPFQDSQFEYIWFKDCLEHLPDVVATMDECWRICAPGGVMHVTHVHYLHPNTWIDPTHIRGFHQDSFDYFLEGTFWRNSFPMYTDCVWKLVKRYNDDSSRVVVDISPIK